MSCSSWRKTHPDSGPRRYSERALMPSLTYAERQELLAQLDIMSRLKQVHSYLEREFERVELRQKIRLEAQGALSRAQREWMLREQLKAIRKELGEAEDGHKDIADLRQRIEKAGMHAEVRSDVDRELNRLSELPTISPEYGVARNYLEWMVSLPWSISTGTPVDVNYAQKVLDEDHYDLEKVKERVLAYLAVLQLRPESKGPILCFTGAPGVGKTSLGKSIARALGRKFVRISLGGLHDEAEIRRHRRTYIRALPGQTIHGLRRAGANDLLFMLTRSTRAGLIFGAIPLRPCSRYSIRSRTVLSAITFSMCRSICRKFCSSRLLINWIRLRLHRGT